MAVREHRKDQQWVPGVINARNGPLSYQVAVTPDTILKSHVDQIRISHMLTTLEFPSTSATPPDVSAAPTDVEITPSSSSPVKQLKPPEIAASSDHHLARTIEPSHSSFPAYPSHTTSGWICKSLTCLIQSVWWLVL